MTLNSRGDENTPTQPEPPGGTGLTVDVTSVGPGSDTMETLKRHIFDHPSVKDCLSEARHRLLSIGFVEPEDKTEEQLESDHFRATVYDYTNNRTVLIDGRSDDSDSIVISESSVQPLPSEEEFQEALEILRGHLELGRAFQDQQAQPYHAMPPLITEDVRSLDRQMPRTIAVGLLPNSEQFPHEIVGVNMINREVIRFESGAQGVVPRRWSLRHPLFAAGNCEKHTRAGAGHGQAR